MTKTFVIIFFAALSVNCINIYAQTDQLKSQIESVVNNKKATVGVSIIANNLKDTINLNETLHFPMQSVFKFPIVLAVLSEVDKGKFRLNQRIKISSGDLLPGTWSPIRDRFPNGTIMTLAEIIQFTVAQSDNNGCDMLLRLIGGTSAVEEFLSQSKVTDIAIKTNEEEMHKDWNTQFQNWATPVSLTTLLIKFFQGEMLSKESQVFLWRIMTETTTGSKRLKGQLPQGTVVAHKTGSSGTNDKNITAATNDIGIIILPDGSPIFITVLVANSAEEAATNEKIISDIAKTTWDYFSKP